MSDAGVGAEVAVSGATHRHPEHHLQQASDGADDKTELRSQRADHRLELQHTQHPHQPELQGSLALHGEKAVRFRVDTKPLGRRIEHTKRKDFSTLGADDHFTFDDALADRNTCTGTHEHHVTRQIPQH